MRKASSVISFAIAAALAGPAATQFKEIPEAQANVFPTNWRAEVIAELRRTVRDPSSVKDPVISAPQLRNMGVAPRYVVCVRMNAKNGFGGFTGPQETMAVFVEGKLSTIREPTPGLLSQCATADYKPFPEALKL